MSTSLRRNSGISVADYTVRNIAFSYLGKGSACVWGVCDALHAPQPAEARLRIAPQTQSDIIRLRTAIFSFDKMNGKKPGVCATRCMHPSLAPQTQSNIIPLRTAIKLKIEFFPSVK